MAMMISTRRRSGARIGARFAFRLSETVQKVEESLFHFFKFLSPALLPGLKRLPETELLSGTKRPEYNGHGIELFGTSKVVKKKRSQ
jgi:hypothetical protein